MELFTTLFSDLLVFVYHCFDRIVIHGYLSGLSRPEQVVHFFRQVVGAPVVSKELLSQRTSDYQNWVEAFARNHKVPIQWAEKGVRKEDYVQPWLRRMVCGTASCGTIGALPLDAISCLGAFRPPVVGAQDGRDHARRRKRSALEDDRTSNAGP